MRYSRISQKSGALAAVACAIVLLARLAQAQNDDADAYRPTEGMEVLTRGPVHEGFAEPIVYNPEPGPVVPKQPPDPIEEIPPDQKPEGENVLWIPGYWSWDDAQGDFLWVSGIWRDVPPGRQWEPGYWVEAKTENGWRRVPGTWASTEQEQVTYLPEPPKTLEAGPNVPEPEAKSLWVPGVWYWGEERYAWRPGYWLPVNNDWVWVPAHYVWTPGGYLFVEGYWDRPLVQRGIVFAPVHFQRPIYTQAQFTYTPVVTLVTTILTTNLFVRPATYQYYFGDYYADRYSSAGYYPWYALQGTRRGYDPVYAHLAAINSRQNPQWSEQLAEVYQYRRAHEDARPPSTYRALRALAQQATVQPGLQQANLTTQNITTIKNINVQNALLAQPIAKLATNERLRPVRFERLAPERRDRIVQQVRELRKFSEARVRDEAKAFQSRPADFRLDRPRSVALPRSPIVAERVTSARSKVAAEKGKAARGLRGEDRAAAPPPRPTQAPPVLGSRPAAPAGLADQKPAEAGKQDRRRVLRPRLDQAEPADTPKAPGPDAKTAPRPDQAKPKRPDRQPGAGPAPRPPDRRGPDQKTPPAASPDDPSRSVRPGQGQGQDRIRPEQLDRPRPGLPGGELNRPRPNLPDRPGGIQPEGRRPGLPGTPKADRPGIGRPVPPGNTPDGPGQLRPRDARPDLGTPRDRPGAARPGLRPDAVLPTPGAADQPGAGAPNRPGLNPANPRGGDAGRGRPGSRPAQKKAVAPAPPPTTPKAAEEPKPEQP